MTIRTLLFACCCASLPSSAQQYLIRYDIAAENIQYFRIKKKDTSAVSLLQLGSSGKVNLQVVNVSNGYRQRVILHEKAAQPETVIIPGLGGAAFDQIQGWMKAGGNLSPEELLRTFRSDEKSGSNIRFEMAIKRFTTSFNQFNNQYLQWLQEVQRSQDYNSLWKSLATLRYNIQEEAPVIRQKAYQQTKVILPELTTQPTDATGPRSTIPSILLSLRDTWRALQEDYSDVQTYNIPVLAVDSSMIDSRSRMMQLDRYLQSNPTSPDELLQRIRGLYNHIQTDRYMQLSPLVLNSRSAMAELRLIPEIDSVTANAIQLSKADSITRYIPLYKKEPLRFRNTFGFGFVSFAEHRWNYYVNRDSVLSREAGDVYQPVIVTYLHFYAPKDKGFRYGGSFGAGIPLSGDDKQLTLMLGLSTFIGKNDPVCITLGVAGTRVKKLSGVALGDKIANPELPLGYNTVYRAGYFFSLTFNPSALNNRSNN